ncbi:hypothetical protein BDV95DRAFT_569971 [Massariosphaeria phaeospora]|uniref:Uncharacterized protein n=1 Tax=Massariosphaeria phaeospora TaxID=100035 RepID=A0A7C8M774_9PLEO|nr:hypothetical protein BDV95DRAFT_569971 [Massariosphaeria phaeospora]
MFWVQLVTRRNVLRLLLVSGTTAYRNYLREIRTESHWVDISEERFRTSANAAPPTAGKAFVVLLIGHMGADRVPQLTANVILKSYPWESFSCHAYWIGLVMKHT